MLNFFVISWLFSDLKAQLVRFKYIICKYKGKPWIPCIRYFRYAVKIGSVSKIEDELSKEVREPR